MSEHRRAQQRKGQLRMVLTRYARAGRRGACGLACAVLVLTGTAQADYYDGLRAFDARNYTRAETEWTASARAGDLRAQFALGELLEAHPPGRPRPVDALAWYAIAAARGDDKARAARDRLNERLTPEQVAQAQTRAAALVVQDGVGGPDLARLVRLSPGAAPAPDAAGLGRMIAEGNCTGVARAVRGGADPNATLETGQSLLAAATRAGLAECVRALLAAGAAPNPPAHRGEPPLVIAAAANNAAIARLLIEGGAAVDAQGPDGRTPLTAAAAANAAQAAELLLQRRARPEATDGSGKTAREVAVAARAARVVEVLDRYDAMRRLSRERILTMQRQLAELGYDPGLIDGLVGRLTINALGEFGRDESVSVERIDDELLAKIAEVHARKGRTRPAAAAPAATQPAAPAAGAGQTAPEDPAKAPSGLSMGRILDLLREGTYYDSRTEGERMRQYCERNRGSTIYDVAVRGFVQCSTVIGPR